MNLLPASPATTNCSQLDYLIALQSEELSCSQLRRSQRIWDKVKAQYVKEDPKVESQVSINNSTVNSSPPLFVESDEDFSQLGQPPPKDIPQKVAIKRKIEKTSMDQGPIKKRGRPFKVRRSSSVGRKRAATPRLTSKLNLKTMPVEPITIVIPSGTSASIIEIEDTLPVKPVETLKNPKNMAKTSRIPIPQLAAPQMKTTSTHANVGTLQLYPQRKYSRCLDSKTTGKQSKAINQPKTTPSVPPTKITLLNPQLTEKNVKIFEETELQSSNSTYSASGTKRGCIEEQPEIVKHSRANTCQINPSVCSQYSNTVNPTDTKPSSLMVNATQSYAYQRLNLTQTLLPERYPAHFIHQLPPESTTRNDVILPSGLGSANATELRRMCPTPDTTPTIAHETEYPFPLDEESTGSTTPSLSDSLAAVFGTRKIRIALNIEPPREYIVQELYLPAIAFMLDVDPKRLRAVLRMTERLAPDQLEHLMQKAREVIIIPSSDDEDD